MHLLLQAVSCTMFNINTTPRTRLLLIKLWPFWLVANILKKKYTKNVMSKICAIFVEHAVNRTWFTENHVSNPTWRGWKKLNNSNLPNLGPPCRNHQNGTTPNLTHGHVGPWETEICRPTAAWWQYCFAGHTEKNQRHVPLLLHKHYTAASLFANIACHFQCLCKHCCDSVTCWFILRSEPDANLHTHNQNTRKPSFCWLLLLNKAHRFIAQPPPTIFHDYRTSKLRHFCIKSVLHLWWSW